MKSTYKQEKHKYTTSPKIKRPPQTQLDNSDIKIELFKTKITKRSINEKNYKIKNTSNRSPILQIKRPRKKNERRPAAVNGDCDSVDEIYNNFLKQMGMFEEDVDEFDFSKNVLETSKKPPDTAVDESCTFSTSFKPSFKVSNFNYPVLSNISDTANIKTEFVSDLNIQNSEVVDYSLRKKASCPMRRLSDYRESLLRILGDDSDAETTSYSAIKKQMNHYKKKKRFIGESQLERSPPLNKASLSPNHHSLTSGDDSNYDYKQYRPSNQTSPRRGMFYDEKIEIKKPQYGGPTMDSKKHKDAGNVKTDSTFESVSSLKNSSESNVKKFKQNGSARKSLRMHKLSTSFDEGQETSKADNIYGLHELKDNFASYPDYSTRSSDTGHRNASTLSPYGKNINVSYPSKTKGTYVGKSTDVHTYDSIFRVSDSAPHEQSNRSKLSLNQRYLHDTQVHNKTSYIDRDTPSCESSIESSTNKRETRNIAGVMSDNSYSRTTSLCDDVVIRHPPMPNIRRPLYGPPAGFNHLLASKNKDGHHQQEDNSSSSVKTPRSRQTVSQSENVEQDFQIKTPINAQRYENQIYSDIQNSSNKGTITETSSIDTKVAGNDGISYIYPYKQMVLQNVENGKETRTTYAKDNYNYYLDGSSKHLTGGKMDAGSEPNENVKKTANKDNKGVIPDHSQLRHSADSLNERFENANDISSVLSINSGSQNSLKISQGVLSSSKIHRPMYGLGATKTDNIGSISPSHITQSNGIVPVDVDELESDFFRDNSLSAMESGLKVTDNTVEGRNSIDGGIVANDKYDLRSYISDMTTNNKSISLPYSDLVGVDPISLIHKDKAGSLHDRISDEYVKETHDDKHEEESSALISDKMNQDEVEKDTTSDYTSYNDKHSEISDVSLTSRDKEREYDSQNTGSGDATYKIYNSSGTSDGKISYNIPSTYTSAFKGPSRDHDQTEGSDFNANLVENFTKASSNDIAGKAPENDPSYLPEAYQDDVIRNVTINATKMTPKCVGDEGASNMKQSVYSMNHSDINCVENNDLDIDKPKERSNLSILDDELKEVKAMMSKGEYNPVRLSDVSGLVADDSECTKYFQMKEGIHIQRNDNSKSEEIDDQFYELAKSSNDIKLDSYLSEDSYNEHDKLSSVDEYLNDKVSLIQKINDPLTKMNLVREDTTNLEGDDAYANKKTNISLDKISDENMNNKEEGSGQNLQNLLESIYNMEMIDLLEEYGITSEYNQSVHDGAEIHEVRNKRVGEEEDEFKSIESTSGPNFDFGDGDSVSDQPVWIASRSNYMNKLESDGVKGQEQSGKHRFYTSILGMEKEDASHKLYPGRLEICETLYARKSYPDELGMEEEDATYESYSSKLGMEEEDDALQMPYSGKLGIEGINTSQKSYSSKLGMEEEDVHKSHSSKLGLEEMNNSHKSHSSKLDMEEEDVHKSHSSKLGIEEMNTSHKSHSSKLDMEEKDVHKSHSSKLGIGEMNTSHKSHSIKLDMEEEDYVLQMPYSGKLGIEGINTSQKSYSSKLGMEEEDVHKSHSSKLGLEGMNTSHKSYSIRLGMEEEDDVLQMPYSGRLGIKEEDVVHELHHSNSDVYRQNTSKLFNETEPVDGLDEGELRSNASQQHGNEFVEMQNNSNNYTYQDSSSLHIGKEYEDMIDRLLEQDTDFQYDKVTNFGEESSSHLLDRPDSCIDDFEEEDPLATDYERSHLSSSLHALISPIVVHGRSGSGLSLIEEEIIRKMGNRSILDILRDEEEDEFKGDSLVKIKSIEEEDPVEFLFKKTPTKENVQQEPLGLNITPIEGGTFGDDEIPTKVEEEKENIKRDVVFLNASREGKTEEYINPALTSDFTNYEEDIEYVVSFRQQNMSLPVNNRADSEMRNDGHDEDPEAKTEFLLRPKKQVLSQGSRSDDGNNIVNANTEVYISSSNQTSSVNLNNAYVGKQEPHYSDIYKETEREYIRISKSENVGDAEYYFEDDKKVIACDPEPGEGKVSVVSGIEVIYTNNGNSASASLTSKSYTDNGVEFDLRDPVTNSDLEAYYSLPDPPEEEAQDISIVSENQNVIDQQLSAIHNVKIDVSEDIGVIGEEIRDENTEDVVLIEVTKSDLAERKEEEEKTECSVSDIDSKGKIPGIKLPDVVKLMKTDEEESLNLSYSGEAEVRSFERQDIMRLLNDAKIPDAFIAAEESSEEIIKGNYGLDLVNGSPDHSSDRGRLGEDDEESSSDDDGIHILMCTDAELIDKRLINITVDGYVNPTGFVKSIIDMGDLIYHETFNRAICVRK